MRIAIFVFLFSVLGYGADPLKPLNTPIGKYTYLPASLLGCSSQTPCENPAEKLRELDGHDFRITQSEPEMICTRDKKGIKPDVCDVTRVSFTYNDESAYRLQNHRTKLGILYIHGFMMDGDRFYSNDYLHRDSDINQIRLTLPGHSMTGKAKYNAIYSDWLKAVRESLEILKGTSDKVIIVSESLGGLLAAWANVKFPHLVDGNVMVEPALSLRSWVLPVACFTVPLRIADMGCEIAFMQLYLGAHPEFFDQTHWLKPSLVLMNPFDFIVDNSSSLNLIAANTHFSILKLSTNERHGVGVSFTPQIELGISTIARVIFGSHDETHLANEFIWSAIFDQARFVEFINHPEGPLQREVVVPRLLDETYRQELCMNAPPGANCNALFGYIKNFRRQLFSGDPTIDDIDSWQRKDESVVLKFLSSPQIKAQYDELVKAWPTSP